LAAPPSPLPPASPVLAMPPPEATVCWAPWPISPSRVLLGSRFQYPPNHPPLGVENVKGHFQLLLLPSASGQLPIPSAFR
jgi:hypothetical protein